MRKGHIVILALSIIGLAIIGTILYGMRNPAVLYQGNITAELQPEDGPEFRREYEATLTRGFTVHITMYTSSFGRTDRYGEVKQSNGKWILFDVHSVADKIIDRELYPEVQKATDQILALDKEFMRNPPRTFKDKSGVVWARQ